MSSGDDTFNQGDAGSSNTEFVQAGKLKNGSLVMMAEKYPCKVTEIRTAKPGKHGAAKAMITAKDIFTDQQYVETFGTKDNVHAPVTSRTDFQLLAVESDQCQLLNLKDDSLKEDLDLPAAAHLKAKRQQIEKILEDFTHECIVAVLKWGDQEMIVDVREGKPLD